MTKLLVSVLFTLFCSASYAFHQQSTQEVRDNETWITMKLDLGTEARADVLFVIDDSGSMSTHQANLAAQADLISQNLSFYGEVNAAVITSSSANSFSTTGGGKFIGPVLSSASTDFVTNLTKQINVGVNGDATETFFDPIYLATTEPLLSTTNAGFLRPDADLVLILLTDTEDQSQKMTGPTLLTHLQGLKPNNKISVLHVGIVDPKTCMGEQELTTNSGLKDFVTLTNGQTVDLCSDFSKEIPKAIGELKKNLSELVLSALPNTSVDFQTITVKADGKPLALGNLTHGWIYDTANSKIILGSAVVKDLSISKLEVNYKLIQN